MNDDPSTLRPSAAVRGIRPYAVPRHRAPVDLALDGNEGLAAPPGLLRILADADPEIVRRYPKPTRLQHRIAARFGLEPGRVLVTSGGDDALDRAARALLEPGRNLVLPTPTFEMLARYGRLVGAEVRQVPWPEGPYPTEAVLDAVDDDTTAIAVVTPNNPTGAVATADDLRRLAEAAPGVALLVDLAYGEFADEDLTEAALALPNALVFRTLSKAWGLAGLRVGYVMGEPETVGWLRAAGNPYVVSGPSLLLAERRLETAAPEVDDFVARIREERRTLHEALEALGLRPLPSQGNFVFARVDDPMWLRDGMAGLGIGVRVWPGHALVGDATRITCPGDPERFERLRAGLEAVLRPEALLFDMDGVLADVSGSYREAILRTAAHFGVEVDVEDIRRAKAEGDANNDWEVTRRLLASRGTLVSLEEVTEVFERLYQGTPDTPGLRDTEALLGGRPLLERLAARVPLGIVTGRPRRDAVRFLEERGVADLFGAVVCMEDGPLKPDPAPVHGALDALGVSGAWLVGDTPDDVRAARAAGVVPLGVTPPGEDPEALADVLIGAGAARMLGSLDDLEEMLP
ncbi:MAG: TIGR01548 family HAD-type hydrolase [Myxococcota bacterium]